MLVDQWVAVSISIFSQEPLLLIFLGVALHFLFCFFVFAKKCAAQCVSRTMLIHQVLEKAALVS